MGYPYPNFPNISSISKINSNESKRIQRNKNSIIPRFFTYNHPTDHPLAIFYSIKPGSTRASALADRVFFSTIF